MFLGKRERQEYPVGMALTGPVTLPGDGLGVYLEGERRGVAVYSPGGYHWVPSPGDEVLVLKTGERGEKPCAVGVAAGGQGLLPGEVLISAGACAIKLGLDGQVSITGDLTVNGRAGALEPREEDGYVSDPA